MDLFLKFKDEEQALQYLYNVIPAVTNKEGEVTEQMRLEPKFINIDKIGTIYKPTGEKETLEDGIEVPVMEALPGYHVNVRIVNEDISELQQFSITPKNPQRVWA